MAPKGKEWISEKRTGIVNEKIILGKIKEGCGDPLSPMSDMACKVRKKTSISACVIKIFFLLHIITGFSYLEN